MSHQHHTCTCTLALWWHEADWIWETGSSKHFSWLSKTCERQINPIKIHGLLVLNEVSRAQWSTACWAISLQVKDKLLHLLLIMTQKVGFVNLGGNTYIPPLNVSLWLIIWEAHKFISFFNGSGVNKGYAAIPTCSVSCSAICWALWPSMSSDILGAWKIGVTHGAPGKHQ